MANSHCKPAEFGFTFSLLCQLLHLINKVRDDYDSSAASIANGDQKLRLTLLEVVDLSLVDLAHEREVPLIRAPGS